MMDRSAFLKSALAGIGALAGARTGFAQDAAAPRERGQRQAREAVLRICSQESRVPGDSFQAKIKNLTDWGAAGVELHGNPKNRIAEIKEVLADSEIRVSCLCWGSDSGRLVSPDESVRKQGIDNMKSALETSGELNTNGVIFVPTFNDQSDLKPEELDKIMLDILPGLADFAWEHRTRVLIEPLRKGETFYINRLEQAVRFCREINKPGLAMMGDFYHMHREEDDERAAFENAGRYLRHVHIASRRTRRLPGTDEDSYVEGLKGLKAINYRQFVSLECGIQDGQDPMKAVPESFDLIRRQWEEATV